MQMRFPLNNSSVDEQMNNFCVYEHWRSDINVCFYVGKGKLRRAKSLDRNDRHNKVVNKLLRIGAHVEVKIVKDGLSEDEAFLLERRRIAFWRKKHDHLTNMTDGGDGASGYKFLPSQKEKIRLKALGRTMSEEARRKMSIARTGQKRTAETRRKMSESAKIAQKERFAREAQENPEKLRSRMTMISRKAANDPALRAIRSENAKKLWQNPEYRNRVLNARRT